MAASGLIVAASFLSGAARVQLGASSLQGALAAALTLGLAHGVAAWTFGPLGAHVTPWVTTLWWGLGGGASRRVPLHLAAQVLGGAVGALAFGHVVGPLSLEPPVLRGAIVREALASLLVTLSILGVAHRRDARVPLSFGASACVSLLVAGSATVASPVAAVAVAARGPRDAFAWVAARLVLGQAAGLIVGGALAKWLLPWCYEAARALLFRPRGAGSPESGRG